jgi:hypothetical protein
MSHSSLRLEWGTDPTPTSNQFARQLGESPLTPSGPRMVESAHSHPCVLSRIPMLMISTHIPGSYLRSYSLPRSGKKPNLDEKLDRVFQMAEHLDARCVDLLGAASQKRRTTVFVP